MDEDVDTDYRVVEVKTKAKQVRKIKIYFCQTMSAKL